MKSENVAMWDPMGRSLNSKCLWCREPTASKRRVCNNCQSVDIYARNKPTIDDEYGLPDGEWVSAAGIQRWRPNPTPLALTHVGVGVHSGPQDTTNKSALVKELQLRPGPRRPVKDTTDS